MSTPPPLPPPYGGFPLLHLSTPVLKYVPATETWTVPPPPWALWVRPPYSLVVVFPHPRGGDPLYTHGRALLFPFPFLGRLVFRFRRFLFPLSTWAVNWYVVLADRASPARLPAKGSPS